MLKTALPGCPHWGFAVWPEPARSAPTCGGWSSPPGRSSHCSSAVAILRQLQSTRNMTASEGRKRTMYPGQHSGSRWATPRGNIGGKVLAGGREPGPGRGRRALRERCQRRRRPEPGPGHKQLLHPAGREPGPGAPRDRVRQPPRCPGRRLFQAGPGASSSPGTACSSRLGCFQTLLLGEEVNVGCRSPFAAEGGEAPAVAAWGIPAGRSHLREPGREGSAHTPGREG